MKPLIYIPILIVILASFIAGMYYGHRKPALRTQPLRLEEILSIKELHLVKHVYQDLFFLHKKNNQSKAIRAIVQVPVEITAYLNLKEIEVVYHNDSIKQVILPRANLNAPQYKVDQMVVRQTHAMQIHMGKDLYPEVSVYLSAVLKERMYTVRKLAISNRIVLQTEAEGKMYIERLLKEVGREDIRVTFGDEDTDHQAMNFSTHQINTISNPPRVYEKSQLEKLSFGFIPLIGNQ
ncbi:MAG TPA: DUF4230 domain-containing protein [Chryseolinea sp.]|nr:DUF4230 domain-containing protein [Chryseolinea sp.]